MARVIANDWLKTHAKELAERAVEASVEVYTAKRGMTTLAAWFEHDGAIVAVVAPTENARDVDEVLAYGLFHAKSDGRLLLVLPKAPSFDIDRGALARAPWLTTNLE